MGRTTIQENGPLLGEGEIQQYLCTGGRQGSGISSIPPNSGSVVPTLICRCLPTPLRRIL